MESINRRVIDAFHTGVKTDFRSVTDKDKEMALVCGLLNNKRLYVFVCTVLFKLIQHAKKVGLSDPDIVSVIKSYKVGAVILKLGYTVTEATELISVADVGAFIQWNMEHSIPFMQVMGASYKFQTSNEFVKLCIDADAELQATFMGTVQTYFKISAALPYQELQTEIINKSYGFWFYLWVVTFLMSDTKNMMHRNVISDPDYIRMWDKSIEFGSGDDVSKYKTVTLTAADCKYDQLRNFEEKSLVIGSTFMVPRQNGIWFNLMRHYKKEVIAGPSSSSVLSYQIIFDITKIMAPTAENKILLLLCILCHYSMYYHSISEVLQSYTVDAQLPTYTLDMNDIEYIYQVAGPFLEPRAEGGRRRTRRPQRTRRRRL
jgi:hypothetical protein